MAGSSDKLEKLLGSPEAMSRIAELAKSFASGGAEEESAPPPDEPTVSAALPTAGLGELARMVSDLNINPAWIGKLGAAASRYGERDSRVALLEAIRPFVKSENAATVDRAVTAMKIARAAGAVLRTEGGGRKRV